MSTFRPPTPPRALLMLAGNALAGGAPILHERNLRWHHGVTMIAAPLPSMRREAGRSGFAEGIE
ncbi:Hypothetical protein BN69_1031 [Methylocystis sp. SC2]|nr:Hypothetical protein BN69_1031 [Methylocystis sp. SC2]